MRTLRSPALLGGAGIVVLLVLVALLAPAVAPYDPLGLSGDALEQPSSSHLFGTNNIGQDIWSQVLWGTRASLTVAVGAATLAVLLGLLVGAGGALVGGGADLVASRLVDVSLAVPRLPLLLLASALMGPSRLNVTVLIGLLTWPIMARILRSQTLSLRQRGFVASARGFGGGTLYTLRRHVAPALSPMVVAGLVTVAARAILLEASLAFLGLADPTSVSWGLMLNKALAHPGIYFTPMWPWWILPAGFAITLAVVGFTFLGMGLEPVLNPRWRRTLS
ncbi:MAG: ABC transporter permease [Actinomycetota bacterium]|nr:ABC transporter permease [Actinomycetota bacterium]